MGMRRKTAIYATSVPALFITLTMLLKILTDSSRSTDRIKPIALAGIVMDLLCALLTASVFISIAKNGRQERLFMKLFLWMLALNTVALIGDALSWGVGFDGILASPAAVSAGSFIAYSAGYPLIVLFSIYLLSYINEDPRELQRYSVLIGGLSADGFLLVVIAQFTAADPNSPWKLSEHLWVLFFFIIVPMAVSSGTILYFRKKLTNRKALTFLSFELISALSVAAEILLGGVRLAYATVAILLVLIYISVQTEYEKQKEQELAQQRISMMLSQIHPHFLYNVLTGIKSLCHTDADAAEQALVSFTAFLRGNLNSLTNSETIPFQQELEHTKRYLELEKMRFGDDLKVRFDTPVTAFSLPPLSLQPIVENAVRHGVMRRDSGGTVTVTTAETEKGYTVTVSDDGMGFDVRQIEESHSGHIGIANVRGRLHAFCNGSLEIVSAVSRGTTATITIPQKRSEGKKWI